MASDVVMFQIQTFLNCVEEVTPKLPLTLSKEFDHIKKYMEDANLVNKNTFSSNILPPAASSSLIPLLNDLNDALAECSLYAEQSQNISESLSTCHYYNPFHQTFSVRKMKQTLKSNKHKLVQMISELRISSMPLFPTARYTSFHSIADSQLLGFDEQEKEIRDLICENRYNAIGVYGMAGSGKTALILKVLNSPNVRNQFSPIIWLCLSDIQSKEDSEYEVNIVKFILCELGCDVDKWTVTNPSKTYLLEHLKNLLMRNKYLIVFDDVWENHEFYSNLGDALPLPLPLPGSDIVLKNQLWEALPRDGGGKIIVTSRQKEVVKNMVGEKNLICMKPLNREICRTMLENEIGLTGYVKKIEGWVNSSGFVSIGICGQSSSANSAVVRMALRNNNIASFGEKFEPVIWVPTYLVSLNFYKMNTSSDGWVPLGVSEDEIMKHLLKELGCGEDELTNDSDELAEKIKKSLGSKKYLIVLADIGDDYNPQLRDDLSSIFPRDGGGKVIMTSKSLEPIENVDYLLHVRLPELVNNQRSEVLMDRPYISDDIVDQCGGLPFAIKTMVKIIREKAHHG